MNEITVKPIDTKMVGETETTAKKMLLEAERGVITNQGSFEGAAKFLGRAKKNMKDADTLRRSMTKPLDTVRQILMDLFRPTVDCYTKAERLIKDKMLAYRKEQNRIRIEQERKLQAETEKKRQDALKKADEARANGNEVKAEKFENKADAVPDAPILADRVQKVNGISKTGNWKFDIIDEMIVPREFLKINDKELRGVPELKKKNNEVPGVRFYFVEDISSRAER